MSWDTWLFAVLSLLPSPAAVFPGVAPGMEYVEMLRLVALVTGVVGGVALVIVGVVWDRTK